MIAGGSRGDVQPYIALGKGLTAAGHTVRLLAIRNFQGLVTAYDLDFVALGPDVEALAQNQMQAIVERGNLLEILSATGRGAQQLAHLSAVSGLVACREADLIVAGLGGLFVGLALSEKLGIPFLQAHLFPFTPTREFSSVLIPWPQSTWARWANPMSHRLTQQAMWQMFRAADTQVRTQVLQMAGPSIWGPFDALRKQTRSILYGYSRQVIPPPSDWADIIHVTGYWFFEPPPAWEPPTDVVRFLEAGPPPVYVGFAVCPAANPKKRPAWLCRRWRARGSVGCCRQAGAD